MVGADVPGRPPPARTRTTPVDDASTRAAEDVGPYQRRTPHDTQRRALTARAEPHTSCGAQGRIHMVGADVPGRPPPVRTGTTPVDDASTRAAEDVGPYQRRTSHDTQRRALTARAEPHTSCGAQGRIHMVGADVLGRPPPAQGRRRWTMRPRGPPRTSAPTNAAQPWCAGPRTHHVARRTTMRTTHLPMRDLFARLTTESNDMRPFPRRSTQATCHGVPDNIRPFLGIMGLVSYACIKETTLKAKMPRLRQK